MPPTTSVNSMFDPEVVAEMRRQFDEADTDGNGEISANEACKLFARHSSPHATSEEVQRTASGLLNQMDADRSATISFDEYCFRFGRKFQMELARKKRAAGAETSSVSSNAKNEGAASPEEDKLRREREALDKEREALRREREDLKREREQQPDASKGDKSHDSSTQLAPGTQVLTQGLRGAPELNGRTGTVLRFDAVASRYVVELAAGGGQKSLRPENVKADPSAAGSGQRGTSAGGSAPSQPRPAPSGPGVLEKVKSGFWNVVVNIQTWLATYEWWQIALGVAILVVFVGAWWEVSSKYAGDGRGIGAHRTSHTDRPKQEYTDNRRDRDFGHGGDREDSRNGRARYEDDDYYQESRGRGRPHRHAQRDYRQRYDYAPGHNEYDDEYGAGGFGGLWGGSNNQIYTMLILGGIGYACWKGIIPVQNMSWFQLYMLWNIVEPLLMGGRGRRRGGMGMGYGGFGRRGFF